MKKDFGPEGVFQKFYKTILKSCPKESTQAPVCDGGALAPVCNGVMGKERKEKGKRKAEDGFKYPERGSVANPFLIITWKARCSHVTVGE